MSKARPPKRRPAKRTTAQGGRRSAADRGPTDEVTVLRERVAALERDLTDGARVGSTRDDGTASL
jgi:hypothetical protein